MNLAPHRSTWFVLFLGFLLAAGCLLRFLHLERKPYWIDEVVTSLQISGRTMQELEQLPAGEYDLEELRSWALAVPERPWYDTCQSLAREDAQHPPLYYLLARAWVKCWGESVAVRRSFSATVSLLSLLLIYWLGLELWGSRRAAALAVGLLAVSPIHVVYAQEARSSALWVALILASSAALLRALRVQKRTAWALYAVTVGLGLYTQLFFTLVLLAHAVFMVRESGWSVRDRFHLPGPLPAYLMATLLGAIPFIPWMLNVVDQFDQVRRSTSWVYNPLSWSQFLSDWRHIYTSLVLDRVPSSWLAIVLLGGAVLYWWRQSPSRARALVLSLTFVPFAALLGPDLVGGAHRTIVARYAFPTLLGLHLALAGWLAFRVATAEGWRKWGWRCLIALVATAGLASSAKAVLARTWWNKGGSGYDCLVFQDRALQSKEPVVVWEGWPRWSIRHLVTLSTRMGGVRVQIAGADEIHLPEGVGDVFALYPSEELRHRLSESGWKMRQVTPGGTYWELRRGTESME